MVRQMEPAAQGISSTTCWRCCGSPGWRGVVLGRGSHKIEKMSET